MEKVIIRFYEELNDFLPVKDKKRDIIVTIQDKVSVREIIRRFGVPLDEVDLILVNGESVDPTHLLVSRDRISVYPVFESFDIGSVGQVRSNPLRETVFLLPAGMKCLAGELRKRNFDVVIIAGTVAEIARRAEREKRILIFSDRVRYRRLSVSRILYVPQVSVNDQLKYIFTRLHLNYN